MYNYADTLESYLIPAEEGFMDGLKKVGKFIGKTLMTIIQLIRKALQSLISKIRELGSRRNEKRESPKEAISRLEKENAELKNKIDYLERSLKDEHDAHQKDIRRAVSEILKDDKKINQLSDKKERASKMIADLKKQIEANDANMEAYKNSVKNESLYEAFQKTCLQFISHVSTQINKAYTVLPKFVADAKKYDGKSKKELFDDDDDLDYAFDRDFYSRLQSSLPTMSSGQWSYLYKSLRFSYLKRVQENPGYIKWDGSTLGRAFEILIKQSNQTIDYLEKMVKDINANEGSQNNPAYHYIISEITRDEGFIPMLRSSISISNEILMCFKTHDKYIIHTIHDAI